MNQILVNPLGMKFVWVSAGTFWMGAQGNQKQVAIDQGFYLGVHPVTQGQWQAVMVSNPSYFSRDGGGAGQVKAIAEEDLKHFPIESVSWYDVQEFLKVLNTCENKGDLVYRLPNEAEWEYACRGGATSPEECAFEFYFAHPTNDLSSAQANFNGNYPAGRGARGTCLERTTKVGSYPANRLGLYDMHGNVWEWCADLYELGGSDRVIRGGAWGSWCYGCRASYRFRGAPAHRGRHWCGYVSSPPALAQPRFSLTNRNNNLGFRLAVTPAAAGRDKGLQDLQMPSRHEAAASAGAFGLS